MLLGSRREIEALRKQNAELLRRLGRMHVLLSWALEQTGAHASTSETHRRLCERCRVFYEASELLNGSCKESP